MTPLSVFALILATLVPPSPATPRLLPEFIIQKHSISMVAFSPDGNLLAVAGGEVENPLNKKPPQAELTVWDLKTPKKLLTLTGHKDYVNCVAFSPDGKTIASSSHDKTVRLWDIHTGKELAVLEKSHWVRSLTFSPDGAMLAGSAWPEEGTEHEWKGKPGIALLWNVNERTIRTKLEGHAGVVFQIVFSPDGKTLATASGRWDKKAQNGTGWYSTGEIKLWDAATAKLKKTLIGHKSGRINALAFSPNGKTFVSGSFNIEGEKWDGLWSESTMWDSGNGHIIKTITFELSCVESLAFSHDGKLLVARMKTVSIPIEGFYDEVILLDPKTLKPTTKLPRQLSHWTDSLAFSPTRRLLAVADGN